MALPAYNLDVALEVVQTTVPGGGPCRQPTESKGELPMSRGSYPQQAVVQGVALSVLVVIATIMVAAVGAPAEKCQTSSDMDAATHTAIVSAAQRYFDMAANGDLANLRQNASPSVASNFSGIEGAVNDHRSEIAGSHGTARPAFLLEVEGTVSAAHSEFFCGVFNRRGQTADSAVFSLDGLSPGKYAIIILDAAASSPSTVSFVLQEKGNEWRLGGLYIKPVQAAGHAADWFLSRARDYKTKNQMHNAWLYYRQALILTSPLPFMKTAATDKIIDESQPLQPADFPADGKTADLAAGGATYKLTALFPAAVGSDLDLIVKYQANDVSDTNHAYQTNVTVIKAMIAKFPELKEAFSGVVARAVESSGRDYGTLLAMKDIK